MNSGRDWFESSRNRFCDHWLREIKYTIKDRLWRRLESGLHGVVPNAFADPSVEWVRPGMRGTGIFAESHGRRGWLPLDCGKAKPMPRVLMRKLAELIRF